MTFLKSFISKTCRTCIVLLVALMPVTSWAAEKETILDSNGGIAIYKNECYWFNLSGVLSVDYTMFLGNSFERVIVPNVPNLPDPRKLPSGANVRQAQLTFQGGIGKDLSYNLTVDINNPAHIVDANLKYLGIDKMAISIGEVSSPFNLEKSNSSKWIPFLERSMPATAFSPQGGLGVNALYWSDPFSINVAATVPAPGLFNNKGVIKKDEDVIGLRRFRSDRPTFSGRFVYVPVHCNGRVLQFGVSGVYAKTNNTYQDGTPFDFTQDGIRIKAQPEAKARNTPFLLDTGHMPADHGARWGVEVAGQWGPLTAQAEYFRAHVNRVQRIVNDMPTISNLKVSFPGYYAQVAYVLTGESREYSFKRATFGRVIPRCKSGAWEVGLRYSYLDLNDGGTIAQGGILGGKERNIAVSLSWYVTKNVRLLGNYIFAKVQPTQMFTKKGKDNFINPAKRNLHILAMRVQIVF